MGGRGMGINGRLKYIVNESLVFAKKGACGES